MANLPSITRRSVFTGAFAATAALAIPAIPAIAALPAKQAWTLNDEQAATILDWQRLNVECNAQWDIYCQSGSTRSPLSIAAYEKWREIYERQKDAQTTMLRSLYYHFRSPSGV